MICKKITQAEAAEAKISSLPTRPNAPSALGGKGYSAEEMKAAFDRFPALIAERLNALIDDMLSYGEDSAAAAIPSGIAEGHTLYDLFLDITSGAMSDYLALPDGENLSGFCEKTARAIGKIIKDTALAPDITLLHGEEYRFGEITGITLTLPESVSDDYYSCVVFDSGESAPAFSCPSSVTMSGDGTSGGKLVPKSNMHYTIFIWYDGAFQGLVRGVARGGGAA